MKLRYATIALFSATFLGSCATQPKPITLADIAAKNKVAVADLVAKGALFCKKFPNAGDVAAPVIIAVGTIVLTAEGMPAAVPILVSTTNQADAAAKAACLVAKAAPVDPPVNAGNVPVEVVETDLPALVN